MQTIHSGELHLYVGRVARNRPKALESVTYNFILNRFFIVLMYFLRVGACVTTIRKYARKSWRYMDAYHGNNGPKLRVKQVEYAVRKYRRHRSVPQSNIDEL